MVELVIRPSNLQKPAIERDVLELETRLEQLKDKNATQMEEGQGLKQCSLLLRKIGEMRSWMKEKLHVALDESYLDLVNVHSKLQRHTVFESEILSNHERLEVIVKEAEDCSLLTVPESTTRYRHQPCIFFCPHPFTDVVKKCGNNRRTLSRKPFIA